MLRIGRTKAYAMAREWRATGGKSGLPVVDFGNVLRVPRHALEELIGAPVNEIPVLDIEPDYERAIVETDAEPVPRAATTSPTGDHRLEPRAGRPHTRPRRQRRTPVTPANQLDLFDAPPAS